MNELLIENGFYFASSCNCHGKHTQTFKGANPNMIIKIRPNQSTFEIILFKRKWADGHIGNLELKFKEALAYVEKPFV